jgi:hypothetical protein
MQVNLLQKVAPTVLCNVCEFFPKHRNGCNHLLLLKKEFAHVEKVEVGTSNLLTTNCNFEANFRMYQGWP